MDYNLPIQDNEPEDNPLIKVTECKNQQWRHEEKIGNKRKAALIKCRSIKPEISNGIYPFSFANCGELNRADLEWLLATHESDGIIGPVNCLDEQERNRVGLDLRGSVITGNLSLLPLHAMKGGLKVSECIISENASANESKQQERRQILAARVTFNKAELQDAELEKAYLCGTNFTGIDFRQSNMQGADLTGANLRKADFGGAKLHGAIFIKTNLQESLLISAILKGADFTDAYLRKAILLGADLTFVRLHKADLRQADMSYTKLWEADLSDAHLEGTILQEANLVGEADKGLACHPANLQRAYFDNQSDLTDAKLGDPKAGFIKVVDIRWQDVNLAVAKWEKRRQIFFRESLGKVGEEQIASRDRDGDGKKDRRKRRSEFEEAERANRQFATILRNQGLHNDADYFSYRAQLCQQKVLWRQYRFGAAFWSFILRWLAGYGYKPERSFFWYVCILTFFLLLFHFPGHEGGFTSIVLSITSFHGRGFLPASFSTSDRFVTAMAAIEAVAGLIIEVSFIAAFTQRYFGK